MLKPNEANADLLLKFAIDRGRSLRQVENVDWTWGELKDRLSQSQKDRLTLSEFKDLPKDRQVARKNNGYFVGARFRKGIRHRNLMLERQIITLDIDQGTPEILKALRTGQTGLGAVEYVVYSTRTHGDGAIKLRLVIPLEKPIPHEYFQAVFRVCAWNVDCHMKAVDTVSFVPSQLMYWPSHCTGVDPIFIHHKGRILDPYAMLEDWAGNAEAWKDHSILPRSPRERAVRESGTTKQDPIKKRGIVGAFCRAYTLVDGIEQFLSEIYQPSEIGADGVPTRYTFMSGTTSNGVQVYEDGHVQSFHGSDPAGGQNLNLFDLVRIHLFGDKDGTKDLADTDPREWPSYKSMGSFLAEDDNVRHELVDDNYGIDPEDLADDSFDAVSEGLGPEVTSDTDDLDDAVAAKPGDTVDELDADEKTVKDWRDGLELTEKGSVKITQANILMILRNSPVFKGLFGHNEFNDLECVLRRFRVKSLGIDFPDDIPGETLISDVHTAAIRMIFSAPRGRAKTGWGMKVAKADIKEALLIVAHENSFHPVRDWLGTLQWDGTSRVDQLWIRGCGTPDSEYHRQTARHFMTASVARIMEPGAKFDFMPVLVGPQGIRKSTFVMTLGDVRWYSETPGYFDDRKKFVESSMGVWFLELGEMTNFRRASDDEAIKAVLSGTTDLVRLSYRENPQRVARQFVMVGTTNATSFLRDKHRRIWPIMCDHGDLDIEWLEANRDQLFAEAAALYRDLRRKANGPILPLYLTHDAAGQFETRQEEHRMESEAETKAGLIREWLDRDISESEFKAGPGFDPGGEEATDDLFSDRTSFKRKYTCAIEVWERALGGDPSKYGQREAQVVGGAMRVLENEWRAVERLQCGRYGRQRGYLRITDHGELDL